MGVPSVLMLAPEGRPVPPLAPTRVEQWIDAVAHAVSGVVPHVVCAPHPGLPDSHVVDGVRYHRIRVGALYDRLFRSLTRLDPYPYVDRIIAYAETVRPEIIHVHDAPQLVARLRAGVAGARLIVHMHDASAVEHGEHALDRLPEVDALCGCSRYITDRFRARGVRARRYVELPSGVDTERFRPARAGERAAALSRHRVPPDRFVVLYVGRIDPEKGPDLLVEAVRRLDPERFHLVLAGEWPQGEPGRDARAVFAESLRARLAGMPVSVLGRVAPEAMPEVYHLGDLLVVPSRREEPHSRVALEAMASGLPALALAKGALEEVVTDGRDGLVLPAEATAAAISAALAGAASAPARIDGLARAARATAEARYAWPHVARRTERLYREILQ